MPRSFAAGLLNRLETSNYNLDEVLAVEFARRDEMTGIRRHRAKLLVSEVIRRRLALDQILKVYSSRPPADMEHHVRTVLRMALAEWFFIPPPPALAPISPKTTATTAAAGRAVRYDDGAPEFDYDSGDDDDADAASDDRHPKDRHGARPNGRPHGNRHSAHSRRGRESRRRDDDHHRAHPSQGPVARGPIAMSMVDLVGPSRPSRGFVNGVLRAIDRDTTFLPDEILAPDEYPRDRIPAADGVGVYRFGRTLFADPHEKPAAWLSQFHSLPKWLTTRFLARYGMQTANEVCYACNAVAALSVRANTRRVQPDELVEEMAEDGLETTRTALPEIVRIDVHVPLIATPWFEEGEIYLQDLTAARAARAVELRPGMRILDACAAPGGKITHACEILDGKGRFVAVDVSERRLKLLRENIARLGHSEIEIVRADFREFTGQTATNGGNGAAEADSVFDVIFLDAPCSNIGVLARRADARWKLADAAQASLIKLQTELVTAALRRLAPNGRIVYSTCTIEPEENRGVVAAVPGVCVETDALWLPEGGTHDGGYYAVLKRESE